jgi:5-methyltetrahydrofolate--homocysteine methyltransferase
MTLKEALASEQVLISDGGFGTELQKLGLGSVLGDEWNLSHPEHVKSVHRRYVDAGSQLITTNTFSSNRSTLAKHGLENKQAEIARAGAAIAKQAIGNRGWVMGDVGPNGEMLKPLGKATVAELEESLRVQIGALLEGGVDAILIETMTAIQEVEVAVRVARQMKAPCIVATCAFDPFKVGPRTNMGVTPQQFAKVAAQEGADVIGANCGKLAEFADFMQLIEGFRSATDLPIIIQPNGGKPTLQDGKFVYTITPEAMADLMLQISQHAKIVGGCCGTNPDHIRAFRDKLPAGRATHG